MEAKKILGLIKDDITHLEEITREFSAEDLPPADDVDLAIIRAKALLTELELLQKLTLSDNQEPLLVQHVDIPLFKPSIQVDPIIMSVEKEKKGQNEQVTPDTESLVGKEQMVENVTPVEIDHKRIDNNQHGIEEQKSINERLRASNQVNNAFLPTENSNLGYPITPIKLIWDAIGINDRFLFVRELFDNNNSKFESTVRSLDELASIQEAVNYLKMNFAWNNSEASQRFLILVKQRFTK